MTTANEVKRGHRIGIATGIMTLGIGLLLYVHAQAELERNLKSWYTGGTIIITGILLLLWFVFFGRFSLRARVGVLGILAILGAGISQTVRVDGSRDGTGRPRFVWRWNYQKKDVVTAVASSISTSASQTNSVLLAGYADTTQFHGSERDGVVRGVKLGTNWNQVPPKLLWRQPIGEGWAGFSVVRGLAYTQEQRGDEEWVSCYEISSGAMKWVHTNKTRFSEWQGGDGPRATPTVSGTNLFSYGATGILSALDSQTGRKLWSRNVLEEHDLPNLIWGVSASPLVFNNTVVVTGGFTNKTTVLAFRADTGEPLWQAGSDKASYASPVLATIAGKNVVVSINAASITIHEPLTGKVLLDEAWSKDKWPKASQPIILSDDRIFVSAGYGVGCRMLQIKANTDGKWSVVELWKNMMMKTQFNSPALVGNSIYGLDDGLLACVDISTGRRLWKDGRFGSGQSLVVGDVVLIQAESGSVAIAGASEAGYVEYGRIAALSSKTWNHPTVAGQYLLVRNDREVSCYNLPLREAK